MVLDIDRILRILPHRASFLLIDEVLELQPRKSARALKRVSNDEPYLRGHFPGAPIFPAVLTLEAMAQLMCVLAYTSDAIEPAVQMFVFTGIHRAKFSHPIRPGDQVFVEIKVLHHGVDLWTCEGTARVGELPCAVAELRAAIQDREHAGVASSRPLLTS